MYQEILVPTDGSPGADLATGCALDLARAFEARVHALYVAPSPTAVVGLGGPERTDLRETGQDTGRAATVGVQDRAEPLDVSVVRELREGTPHEAIRAYAAEADVDLVVMGTRGRNGDEAARLGSTVERVVTRSEVPVVVVPPGAREAIPDTRFEMYDEIVLPTDGSDVAERAAEQALTIAERYGADVHVVYVVDPASHDLEQLPRSIVGLLKEGGEAAVDAIATSARERNLPATTAILRGTPEDAIRQYAAGVDADLIAMGSRGEAMSDDRFLGSTTARVLRRSDTPVLVVG